MNTTYQEEIQADLKRAEKFDLDDPLFMLERIKKYDFGYFYHKKNGIKDRYDPDYYEYKAFIKELYSGYFENYFQEMADSDDRMLSVILANFACSFEPKKYDILVRLGVDKDIYEDAQAALKTETDYPVNKAAFIALAQCYKIESQQYKIKSFFSRAYKEAKEYALRTREYEYLGDNLNSDIYLGITQAITILPAEVREELAEKVIAAYTFLSFPDRSYSANQASGYVAIYLTLFKKQINLSLLEQAITVTGEVYQDSKFVLQTRYTKWLLEKNEKDALAYFKKNEPAKFMEYIVALLADLDCKAALPLLKQRLEVTKKPVFTEVLLEAISRLETQQEPPEPEDRMIWLFESVSPTERALGVDSDNIFIKRAQEKQEIDTNVYETDDE